jgi:hypothetical protein
MQESALATQVLIDPETPNTSIGRRESRGETYSRGQPNKEERIEHVTTKALYLA